MWINTHVVVALLILTVIILLTVHLVKVRSKYARMLHDQQCLSAHCSSSSNQEEDEMAYSSSDEEYAAGIEDPDKSQSSSFLPEEMSLSSIPKLMFFPRASTLLQLERQSADTVRNAKSGYTKRKSIYGYSAVHSIRPSKSTSLMMSRSEPFPLEILEREYSTRITKCQGWMGSGTIMMVQSSKRRGQVDMITYASDLSTFRLPLELPTFGGRPVLPIRHSPNPPVDTQDSMYTEDLSYYRMGEIVPKDILERVSRADYMGRMSKYFLNRYLTDICLLGSHDSTTYDLSCTLASHDVISEAAAYMGNTVLSHMTLHRLRNMGRSQVLTLKEQFETGVRLFDIRATVHDGEWMSVHSFLSNKPLSNYLNELVEVVVAHPTEVCIVIVSKHGAKGMGRGSPLDSLPQSSLLWNEIVDSMGELMIDHSSQPFSSTSIGEYVSSGKRILLFIDGWEVIARGDSRAGKTSDMVAFHPATTDLSNLRQTARRTLKDVESGCRQPVNKFCYVGLNIANSSWEIIRAIMEEGPNLRQLVGKHIKERMSKRLVEHAKAETPLTLLSFSQLNLYYLQHTLMRILADVDAGTVSSLPSAISTDALTNKGLVRVGWLGLGLEADLKNSTMISERDLATLAGGTSLPVNDSSPHTHPTVGVSLGRDMGTVTCDCYGTTSRKGDAARLTFDMFRFCVALSFAKMSVKAISSTEHAMLIDGFRGIRNNVWPSYVDRPGAGLTTKVRELV